MKRTKNGAQLINIRVENKKLIQEGILCADVKRGRTESKEAELCQEPRLPFLMGARIGKFLKKVGLAANLQFFLENTR